MIFWGTHTHTHSKTYTPFLSLREKGQYPEEEIVSHCYDWSHGKVQRGCSVIFIVKLIIPQKKILLPCTHVLSPQQSCEETPPLHCMRRRAANRACRSGKPNEICWTHTMIPLCAIVGKYIILQQEKSNWKYRKKKHFKWALRQVSHLEY